MRWVYEASPTAEQEIEAALKALREAADNDAKRHAADNLEKALQKLRQQLKPADAPRGK
jgi:hypothetical protein